MIETVDGHEAALLFASHNKVSHAGEGLAFLRELVSHFSKLPYENVSKIIKSAHSETTFEAMRLPTEVVVDHIERNFGGTCFSLTFLFERMLTSFGFDCYKVMADMRAGRNLHCLVIVHEPGGKYMVDPGYALHEVIPLPTRGVERAECPHALVEVAGQDGGRYEVWTEDATGRKWRYSFTDCPTEAEDFEKHWLASFGKPTLNNICLTRMTPRGHIYFRKDFFKFTSRCSVDKRRLTRDLEKFVEAEFGIGSHWVEMAQRILTQRREATWRR